MASFRLEVIGVEHIPEVRYGDNVAALIVEACRKGQLTLSSSDILVVAHKIVSKAEGRIVELSEVTPSPFAHTVAKQTGKDPRLVEVVLRECRRIVRMDRGVLVVETHHGFICANGGVDASNVGPGRVALLPKEPDASAAQIRRGLQELAGVQPAVIISDSFGRPWREGTVDVALGIAGLEPLIDYRGKEDTFGYEMKASLAAVADELAGAGELVLGKTRRIPVAQVKGFSSSGEAGKGSHLIRSPEADIFR
ncbi:MAG: coenzyme F420-0:L-glutamate ligase [Candidatus Tectomicrobia bacterium]|uniref:Coenzyme F420-0:L-glutamate ligase n=1 Tax=Tectimicrobiota bacterium TaxID=2528274 RepID=A0A932GP92_UNCTE|nr:coenzyme F420-0:L-glutamate ligase [Candidatus Tectomicrobia bacterium]